MRKIPAVEDAKALMEEARDWSVFTWLWKKKDVRQTADTANEALDQLNKKIKASWSNELKDAHRQFVQQSSGRARQQRPAKAKPWTDSPATNREGGHPDDADSQVILLLTKVKDADDEARRARADAEATFDEADEKMSLDLAREGCDKAIHSWELHEKAIRQAETVLKLSRVKP